MLTHFGHLNTTSPCFKPSFIIFSLVAFPRGMAPWNSAENRKTKTSLKKERHALPEEKKSTKGEKAQTPIG